MSALPGTRGVVRIDLGSRLLGPLLLLVGVPAVVAGFVLLLSRSPTVPIAGPFEPLAEHREVKNGDLHGDRPDIGAYEQ